MSIINDALKKTQQTRKMEQVKRTKVQPILKKPDLKFTWKMASFLTLTALLAILVFRGNPFNTDQQAKQTNLPPTRAIIKPINKVKVAFEGVMLADNMKIAFINKQTLRLGDKVNGMKIIAINPDTVDLQGENGTIQLRAGTEYLL